MLILPDESHAFRDVIVTGRELDRSPTAVIRLRVAGNEGSKRMTKHELVCQIQSRQTPIPVAAFRVLAVQAGRVVCDQILPCILR